jgi:hypothetical protein
VNGAIAAKPRIVQETMWQDLYPRSTHMGAVRDVQEAWQPSVMDESDRWKKGGPQELRAAPRGDKPTFIALSSSGRVLAPIVDARLAFTAVPEANATVFARITSRRVPVTLSVPADGATARGSLDVAGRRTEFDAKLSGPTRVELCVADGDAWAVIGGTEVAHAAVATDGRGPGRVEMGAAGAPVVFRDPAVWRDIQYTPSTRGTSSWDVPAGGFFFIGDNQVEQSDDSREWNGKVFHPPGGAPPVSAAYELIVIGNDGRISRASNIGGDATKWRFRDVDSVAREIPKAGTTVEDRVPMPFARRDHLVGRAILTFFPFPPASKEWRPRLFP